MTENASSSRKKIALHGAPRSGTSWVGQILNSSPAVVFKYQPLFSYRFKDYLDEHSCAHEIDVFFERIAEAEDEFLDQREKIRRGIYPDFKKRDRLTHIVYKEVRYHHILNNMMSRHQEVKVVGIIRNPLAVMNSWFNAPREFRRDLGWEELTEWRYAPSKNCGRIEEFYGYEKWKEVAYMFLGLAEEFPGRFHLAVYSDLLEETLAEVRSLFRFCEIPLEQQTVDFIMQSRAKHQPDPYSVFKMKESDDAWKQELDQQIASEIADDLSDTTLERFLDSG